MIALWVLGCAASALVHLAVIAPRLPAPAPDGDELPPDFRQLRTAGNLTGLTLSVAAAAWLAAVNMQAGHQLLWLAYLGAGGALAWIDLRTTWLPRLLNHLCLAQVFAGLLVLAASDWRATAHAVAGGAAAWALFRLVWALGRGFGYGDVRLAAITGAVAGAGGLSNWLTSILCASVIGACWGVAHALIHRDKELPFPYGPALWLGPVIALALT